MWETLPAGLAAGQVRATLPQADGLVYFVTVTDQRGAVTSSEHEVVPSP